MKFALRNITLFALLFSTLIGCGSLNQLNPVMPPKVSAAGVPVNCDLSGSCGSTYNTAWGYCQFTTHSTAKTFYVALEIGMNSNATPSSPSICEIPLAYGGIIKSIDGNSNYYPGTANVSSLWLDVRSCATLVCAYPADQEHLASHKYTVKGGPQSVPIHGQFANGLTAQAIMFVWNDDLANAKPTTINIDFSGTFQ